MRDDPKKTAPDEAGEAPDLAALARAYLDLWETQGAFHVAAARFEAEDDVAGSSGEAKG